MKIDPNKKIEVYFNLHKKIWSVRQSGKVVGHTNYIEVKDPQYVVSQKGNALEVINETPRVEALWY